MDLNYTCVYTGSRQLSVNFYIGHLLCEVINDLDSEPLDIALRATSWDWDKWFYVPDDVIFKLDEVALEKLKAEITKGLFQVVDHYDDLLAYLRWQAQDRSLVDYIHFVPRSSCVMVYYPHVQTV